MTEKSADLYFIRYLVRAVQNPDTRNALERAFLRILDLGRHPKYAPGYAQFERFMELVARPLQEGGQVPAALVQSVMERLIALLAGGGFEGDSAQEELVRGLVESRPEWREEYRRISGALEMTRSEENIALTLRRGDLEVLTLRFTADNRRQSVTDAFPGHYVLLLETGRVIWERTLSERDLLWAHAFPGEPLELAADTGENAPRATVQDDVLAGDVRLRVYPGVECGIIDLYLRLLGSREA